MNTIRKGKRLSLFLLLVLLWLIIRPCPSRTAVAQTQPDLPPFQPTPEFNQANELLGDSYYQEALQKFELIIQENPGTTLAAESIVEEIRLYYGILNENSVRECYQRLMNLFPGTRYEIIGKAGLADFQAGENWTLQRELTGKVIVEYGGISPDRITSAPEGEVFRSLLANLTPAERNGLPVLYQKVIGEYFDEHEYKDAFKLALFVRQHFPKYQDQESIADLLIETVLYMRLGIHVNTSYFPRDLTPPYIKPIAPHANLTVGEAQPKIEVELWDGDISQAQVALDHVVWTLDGQDLTQNMEVGSVIDKSGQLGPIFERLFLTYVPSRPLSSGPHTVFVKAPDNIAIKARTKESHVSTLQWTFTVK